MTAYLSPGVSLHISKEVFNLSMAQHNLVLHSSPPKVRVAVVETNKQVRVGHVFADYLILLYFNTRKMCSTFGVEASRKRKNELKLA